MTDSTDDYHFSEDFNVQPLIDDCNLLGKLLDDCLKSEVGVDLYSKASMQEPRARLACADPRLKQQHMRRSSASERWRSAPRCWHRMTR